MTIPSDLAPEITSTLRTVANAIEQGDTGAGVALAELGRSIVAMQAPRFTLGQEVRGRGDKGHWVMGRVIWCGTGPTACVGVLDAGGTEWDFAVDALTLTGPTKECPDCEGLGNPHGIGGAVPACGPPCGGSGRVPVCGMKETADV
jgi:hypothetical protein